MAAGFKYNLEPEVEQEERYDVETGRRRRGPYKLDTTNLVVGSYLPSFTPIAADLVKKTSQVAIRVEVYEKFTTGSNTTLKIKKRSLAYKGMHLGNGAHGATINAIDKADKAFDKLTLAADFGENLEAGTVLYEATAADGTTPKVIANSALYERKQVEDGIVLVSLLMRAFEIEPTKLVMPFADIDKANMPHFQFNAQDVKQEKDTVSIPKASSSRDGLMSKEDKAKLDGVAAQANKYILTAATTSALGGVKQAAKVNDASSYFKILENGAIEAISGTIGGIKITNEGLGSYISGWHPIDIPAMKLSNSGLHFSKGIQYNHAGGPQFASYDVDIGADGLFVTVEDSSGGRFYDVMNVVAGRHGLKISNSGVFKTSDGGSTWVEI